MRPKAILLALLISAGAAAMAVAQPMAPPKPTKPTMTAPAMAAMTAPAMTAPKPASMLAAAAPTMDPPMATTMVPPTTAMPAPPAPGKKSTDAKATHWITLLTPIVVGVLIAVLAFLEKKKKLEALKSDRAQTILGFVKTGVESFDKYAKGTKVTWDDSVAKLLADVNNGLIAAGKEPLSEEEKPAVKAQAEALKSLVTADPKPDPKPGA